MRRAEIVPAEFKVQTSIFDANPGPSSDLAQATRPDRIASGASPRDKPYEPFMVVKLTDLRLRNVLLNLQI